MNKQFLIVLKGHREDVEKKIVEGDYIGYTTQSVFITDEENNMIAYFKRDIVIAITSIYEVQRDRQ